MLPAGLYVREVEEPRGKLSVGDVISTVDGRPALPQTLERARFTRGTVTLRVHRDHGDWVELAYP
jgi:hypothetical protein